MTDTSAETPPPPLTGTQWLIVVIAAIGFAFDIYVLLMMPLIARPSLAALLGVDPDTDSGHSQILMWTGYIMYGSALCGGIFGLLGGYLTDLFGRRSVLVWSILLYAFSALASGFSTTPTMLLVLRCTTFIGVCVEFVAAVAWLAELFPHPRQREAILGYTQAFSSFGGILATLTYWVGVKGAENHWFPPIFNGEYEAWRYTLIAGVIPAIPLIVIRPFLPESKAWEEKKARGTLKRPNFLALFAPELRRTSLVTAALMACGFAVPFGVIQMTPQIVPGLDKELPQLVGLRRAYEASEKEEVMTKLKADLEKAREAHAKAEAANPQDPKLAGLKGNLDRLEKQGKAAEGAAANPEKRQELKERIEKLQTKQEETVAGVQGLQEIGGLVGRFALAFLALRIVSRRALLRVFLVPAMLFIPLVYLFPAAGNLSDYNLEVLRAGMFVTGFLAVAQLSFWGNYLPRVYPTHLRGTGESFAANVGGRMVGTAGNPLNGLLLAPWLLASLPGVTRPASVAYAAAIIAFGISLLALVLTFGLPEPKPETMEE